MTHIKQQIFEKIKSYFKKDKNESEPAPTVATENTETISE